MKKGMQVEQGNVAERIGFTGQPMPTPPSALLLTPTIDRREVTGISSTGSSSKNSPYLPQVDMRLNGRRVYSLYFQTTPGYTSLSTNWPLWIIILLGIKELIKCPGQSWSLTHWNHLKWQTYRNVSLTMLVAQNAGFQAAEGLSFTCFPGLWWYPRHSEHFSQVNNKLNKRTGWYERARRQRRAARPQKSLVAILKQLQTKNLKSIFILSWMHYPDLVFLSLLSLTFLNSKHLN